MSELYPAEKRDDFRRKIPERTVFLQKFLDYYRRYGANFPDAKQFCDAFDFNYSYYNKQKERDAAFAAALAQIDAERDTRKAETTLAPILARERWPALDFWKGIFLERYRETVDRMQAADMVMKTWSEIEAALETDPGFSAGFKEIEREIDIRAEDQHKRMAIEGKGSATLNLLTARGSPLGKARGQAATGERPEPGDFASEEARAFYAELFQRHHGTYASRVFEHTPDAAVLLDEGQDEEGGSDVSPTAGSDLAPS